MRIYPLYLEAYPKVTASISAILDCKSWPSWVKFRVGLDRFEITIPNISCKLIVMLLSFI